MPDTVMTIDRAHYDLIVSTARDVKHICRTLDAVADRLEALESRECPCDAVQALQNDATNLKVRVAGLAAAVTLIGNWLFGLIQGVR